MYECPICGRRFKKLYGLASHMHRCHMPAGDYVCPACGRSFRGFQGLLCHIAKSVGDPEHAKYYILYTTATSRGRNVC